MPGGQKSRVAGNARWGRVFALFAAMSTALVQARGYGSAYIYTRC